MAAPEWERLRSPWRSEGFGVLGKYGSTVLSVSYGIPRDAKRWCKELCLLTQLGARALWPHMSGSDSYGVTITIGARHALWMYHALGSKVYDATIQAQL